VLQVVEGVKRLNLGFQNLFTAIEIDDQNTRLNLKRTHFKPIVQRVIREMQSLATFHGVEMKPKLLDVGIIPCDPDKVSKILEIILANAIFYNHRGGRVEIDMKAQGDDLVVTVVDTGIGMSEEEMKHLFEPFFRAQAAKKKFTDGSGLGLYIAKAFAELHGGSLEVESRLHEGAMVRLTIPLAVKFKE
jgi:signal transduction histidine kinase